MSTTIAITGVGVVAPTGLCREEHWDAVVDGRSGIAPISAFDPSGYDVRLAGEVRGFDPKPVVPTRIRLQTDRWTHHSFGAAHEAVEDSGLAPEGVTGASTGVVTASSSSGATFGQREMAKLWAKGPEHVGAYQSVAWFYAATTGQLSIAKGLKGPTSVVCSEQCGGIDAITRSGDVITAGDARRTVTGGTDAALSPYGLVALMSSRMMSTETDPARAYRPFAADAPGFLPGEGGAFFVLERREDVVGDGRTAYATVAGSASTMDPAPWSGRPRTLAVAIRAALADAGVEPSDIGVVYADAMGTLEDDRAESAALREVFGPYAVPVTAPKSLTGRLLGGGSALDVATACLGLRDGIIPATTGVSEAAPEHGLDLVTGGPRPLAGDHAIVLSRGNGGFNAALVLRGERGPQGRGVRRPARADHP